MSNRTKPATGNEPPGVATAFDQEAFDQAYPAGIERHYWTRARNEILARMVSRYGPKPFAGLEVGCGRGVVLSALLKKGINVKGVELAPVKPPQHLLGQMWGGVPAQALAEEMRQQFNSILLLDVLEHLPDPVAFLRDLLPSFCNVSFLLMTVPARQEIWSNYDEHFGHFRRYDLEGIKEIAREVEGDVLYLGYFFHALYFAARLQLKMQSKREVQMKPPGKVGSIVHGLIARAFSTEHLLFPRTLRGSSIIAAIRLKN